MVEQEETIEEVKEKHVDESLQDVLIRYEKEKEVDTKDYLNYKQGVILTVLSFLVITTMVLSAPFVQHSPELFAVQLVLLAFVYSLNFTYAFKGLAHYIKK